MLFRSVWLWKEKNFPVKIEVTSAAGSTTIDFENVKFDPEIAANLFQVPEGVKVMDLPIPPAPAEGMTEAAAGTDATAQPAAEKTPAVS